MFKRTPGLNVVFVILQYRSLNVDILGKECSEILEKRQHVVFTCRMIPNFILIILKFGGRVHNLVSLDIGKTLFLFLHEDDIMLVLLSTADIL